MAEPPVQLTKYQKREIIIRQVLDEAEKGKLSPFVENILNGNLDVDQMDARGYTAIHLAVWKQETEHIIKLLDKAACPIDLPSGSGQTPLILAAALGSLQLIKFFLDRGADLEIKDNLGMTPLMTAVQNGKILAFYCLLHRGAKTDAVDKNGCGLVHWAAYRNQVSMLRVLKLNGFNMNLLDLSGMNCLHRAALSNAVNAVEYLMFIGVCSEEKDAKGRSALEIAKENRSIGALACINRFSIDGGPFFQYFSYLFVFFWIAVYACYQEFVFEFTSDDFFMSVLFNFSFLWIIALFVYLLFRLCKCSHCVFIQPAIDSPASSSICEQFDKEEFGQMIKVEDICVSCQIKRPARSKHCRFTDRCIAEYDHYSYFLGKPIGKGNKKVYFLAVFTNFVALECFLYLTWSTLDGMIKGNGYFSSYIVNLVMLLIEQPGAFKAVVVLAMLAWWYNWWYLLILGFSTAKGLTLNETLNRHRYRYLFEIIQSMDEKPRMRFRNPFDKGIVSNFLEFFMG